MTKDFAGLACQILDILREEKEIHDVMLMSTLHFTPDTWRRWRSDFVKLFTLTSYQKENSEDENDKEKIVYDKKQKLWSIQDV